MTQTMDFDVFAKYGRYWCYQTTLGASSSKEACELAAHSSGRKLWAARPAGTSVKLFKHPQKAA